MSSIVALRRAALAGGVAALSAGIACSASTPDRAAGAASASVTSSGGTGGAGGAGGGGGGVGGLGAGGGGGAAGCFCAPGPHNDHIYVLSSDAELWTYDPADDTFAMAAAASCGGSEPAYSMAVDPLGRAWVMLAASHDLVVIDAAGGGGCVDPGYTPDQGGFGLFGMAFAAAGPEDACARLYAHSYSGAGPFDEGPGAGKLGVMDPADLTLSAIAPIDFDGGELAGTGDGRLFAFAGVSPAKLVEYDKATGEVVTQTPLDGFFKTNASAFAFYAGDIYFFTEAPPAGCHPCLAATCAAAYDACTADPTCAGELACVIAAGDFVGDECGGGLAPEMQSCVFSCDPSCFPPADQKVSQVTRMDYDGSDGPGQALTVVVPAAPLRIVGAGASTCVPTVPR